MCEAKIGKSSIFEAFQNFSFLLFVLLLLECQIFSIMLRNDLCTTIPQAKFTTDCTSPDIKQHWTDIYLMLTELNAYQFDIDLSSFAGLAGNMQYLVQRILMILLYQ